MEGESEHIGWHKLKLFSGISAVQRVWGGGGVDARDPWRTASQAEGGLPVREEGGRGSKNEPKLLKPGNWKEMLFTTSEGEVGRGG